MIDIEYANAYSEVLEILKFISREDYNKIPKNKIELFETNANTEYKFTYNPNRTLDEQNVSKRAKAIIAILFRDYWATSIQKEKIIAKQEHDRMQIEKKKREIYSSDNLFKNHEKEKLIEDSINNAEFSIIEHKQNLFQKLINKIREKFMLK